MTKTAEERIGINETEIGNLKDSDEKQWSSINKMQEFMRKLVPVWVTVVLTAMGMITGSALTFAGMMIKFAGRIR